VARWRTQSLVKYAIAIEWFCSLLTRQCRHEHRKGYLSNRVIDRVAGTAVGQGAVKEVRAMEACKKQKIVTNYVCFCAASTLTSKVIAQIIETILNFVGARIVAIDYFTSTLINHKITYDSVMKRHLRRRCPLLKGQGEIHPLFHRSPASLK